MTKNNTTLMDGADYFNCSLLIKTLGSQDYHMHAFVVFKLLNSADFKGSL
jgi:hypothetical protein